MRTVSSGDDFGGLRLVNAWEVKKPAMGATATFPARVSEAAVKGCTGDWQRRIAARGHNCKYQNFSPPFHIVGPDLLLDDIFISVCLCKC